MGEPKEDPEEAEDAEGPSDEELEAAMVEILKDAKDDFSIKDLLNKLREWSFLPRPSTSAASCSGDSAPHIVPLPMNTPAMTLQTLGTKVQVSSIVWDIAGFTTASSQSRSAKV